MLHKGFSLGGAKCRTRGFSGPKKGFSWLPNAQVQKVSPAAPKKSPAAQPFDFEGKRREKTGKFYDANKQKTGKNAFEMLARGQKFGGAADPLLNFLLGYTRAN